MRAFGSSSVPAGSWRMSNKYIQKSFKAMPVLPSASMEASSSSIVDRADLIREKSFAQTTIQGESWRSENKKEEDF